MDSPSTTAGKAKTNRAGKMRNPRKQDATPTTLVTVSATRKTASAGSQLMFSKDWAKATLPVVKATCAALMMAQLMTNLARLISIENTGEYGLAMRRKSIHAGIMVLSLPTESMTSEELVPVRYMVPYRVNTASMKSPDRLRNVVAFSLYMLSAAPIAVMALVCWGWPGFDGWGALLKLILGDVNADGGKWCSETIRMG